MALLVKWVITRMFCWTSWGSNILVRIDLLKGRNCSFFLLIVFCFRTISFKMDKLGSVALDAGKFTKEKMLWVFMVSELTNLN